MGAWHDTHFLQDICELGACFGKTTTDPVLGDGWISEDLRDEGFDEAATGIVNWNYLGRILDDAKGLYTRL